MTQHTGRSGKRSIALIGMRGCGKSTVGQHLAKLLGGECADTDEVVAQQAGQSIADIFVNEGEAGFRRRERHAIGHIVANPPAVIAVGGGAVLDDRNVEALRRVATVVWLTAPAGVLWERISSDDATKASRPPLTDRPGLAEVERLLSWRSPVYQRAADVALDTSGDTPEGIARDLATQLGLLGA
jgi:shikimate kinase